MTGKEELVNDLTLRSKKALVEKLKRKNLFWSYNPDSVKKASDSVTIQTTMLYGDLDELEALLYIFPATRLKREWNKLFSKNQLFRREGIFVASYLFGEKAKL